MHCGVKISVRLKTSRFKDLKLVRFNIKTCCFVLNRGCVTWNTVKKGGRSPLLCFLHSFFKSKSERLLVLFRGDAYFPCTENRKFLKLWLQGKLYRELEKEADDLLLIQTSGKRIIVGYVNGRLKGGSSKSTFSLDPSQFIANALWWTL